MALFRLSCTLLLLLPFRVQANFDNHAEEFFLGFPPNQNFPQFITKRLHLSTRESTTVSVNITVGNGLPENVVVQPGKVTEFEHLDTVTVSSSNDLNKGVHVKAESGKKIAVLATSHHQNSAGSFIVLPCHTYSPVSEYVYYAVSSKTAQGNMDSTLLLVGSSDGTRVTLTPSQNVSIPAQLAGAGVAVDVRQGTSYTFTLNRLQTFLIRHSKDLTGTKVVSSRPMAVISSHQCANVPSTVEYCDFIVEQIPPTVTWGKRHLARSFAGRSSSAHYRVIASNNETALNITCRNSTGEYDTKVVSLKGGEMRSHETNSNTTCSFLSSKPVMVVQLAEGGQSEGFGGQPEGFGDPLSVVVTPIEQYASDLSTTVPVFSYTKTTSQGFLEIYSTANDNSLKINNQSLPSMEPVYSNIGIVGYVSTVPVPSDANCITVTSSGNVQYLVRYYRFSSDFNGMGHPSIIRLDPIAVPWISVVNNTTVNINESVGSAALPIMVAGDSVSPATVTVLQCNGSPLPSRYQVEPFTVASDGGLDSFYNAITIYTSKNDVLDEKECLCLELSPVENSNVFFNDNYRAQLCYKDDDSLTIELVRAVLVQDELQMTFSASEYTGSVLVPLVFFPEIRYPDLATSNQTLSNFTMYYTFTPQLTEITYSVELNSEVFWTESPYLVVSLLATNYNINFDQNTFILDNPTPTRPNTSQTEMSRTESPATASLKPARATVATSAVSDMENSQQMVPLWTLIVSVCGLLVAAFFVVIAISCCLYFGLRYKRKSQVSEESPPVQGQPSCRRSFSEGNLSPQRYEERTILNTSPEHLCLPYRNSYVFLSTPSISLANGALSAAISEDSCRGSCEPLYHSKPSSPIHSSTAV